MHQRPVLYKTEWRGRKGEYDCRRGKKYAGRCKAEWTEAVNTATYLKSCSHMKAVSSTEEAWTCKKGLNFEPYLEKTHEMG
jgi:hypothetical protein